MKNPIAAACDDQTIAFTSPCPITGRLVNCMFYNGPLGIAIHMADDDNLTTQGTLRVGIDRHEAREIAAALNRYADEREAMEERTAG